MQKYLFYFLISILFVACEKENTDDNEDPTTQQPSEPDNYEPTAAQNADAVLVALNTSATINAPIIGPTTQITGLAFASFNGNSAGEVTCEGEKLSNNNGSYIFSPNAANPTGIDFDSDVEWDATGSSNVNAFNYTYNKAVPEIGMLTGVTNDEVDLSTDFTLGIDMSDAATDLSPADSLVFAVYDEDGNFLLRTQAKSQTSTTFTASELADLNAGFGYVQVSAFTYLQRTEGNLDVVYINQGASTIAVDLK